MPVAQLQPVTNPVSANGPDVKPSGIAAFSIPDALAALKVNADAGLTEAEVAVRRKESGYNEVAQTKELPVQQFLRKFWGISAWMLEMILVLSAVLRKFSEVVVVSALLVLNAVLSFMQERRAAGFVDALRKRLQVSARALRHSTWATVPARDLVPGDIVRVRPGDIIPADVKVLSGMLTVDQSALTGESKDIDKRAGEVLASGSVVRRGEGDGRGGSHRCENPFWPHDGVGTPGASQASYRSSSGQSRPLDVRDCRCATEFGAGPFPDSRRAAAGDDSTAACAAAERGAGRAAGHVHSKHSCRV